MAVVTSLAEVTELDADLVFKNGRVIDPETGFDEICDLAVSRGRITSIGVNLHGRLEIDVTDLVVAPGFIDLHSHAHSSAGQWLQVSDGVTTSLELECGAPDVAKEYRRRATEGSVTNFGYSASWAGIRMKVLGLLARYASSGDVLQSLGMWKWGNSLDDREIQQVLKFLEGELKAGALGVGILLGYAQEVDPSEIRRIAALATSLSAPAFIHARALVEQDPSVLIDGAEEIAALASETGCHMHYCHINSTSNQHLDRVATLVDRVRSEGARVTAESYPYGSAMTVIGAETLHPDVLQAYELDPSDIFYCPTGKWVRDVAELRELRAATPEALVFERYYDEDESPERLNAAVGDPDWALVSDAMPLVGEAHSGEWPLPHSVRTHPRTAGTFSRMLRFSREKRTALTLMETIGKMTIVPCRVLEGVAPEIAKRGRLQQGCFADVTVFDPDTVSDCATYDRTTLPSTGIVHVLINGEFAIRYGQPQFGQRSGQPIRNSLF